MKCGACGKTGLQSTSLALVLDYGTYEPKRVCGECRKNALVLVVATADARPAHTPITETERTTRDVLRSLAKELRGAARVYAEAVVGDEHCAADAEREGRAMGLEQAADVAEAWASRTEARKEGT